MSVKIRSKGFLARRLPIVLKTLQRLHLVYLSRRSSRRTFTQMYRTNGWCGCESLSGAGYTLLATEPLRALLPQIIHDFKISSLLDAGCGDFNWMKEINFGIVDYIGVDVVDEVIARNISLYSSDKHHFTTADVTRDDLPKVDLILCRDCLTHLPNTRALLALRQFKRSGSVYLLTTTHPHLAENADTFIGGYRPLNLERSPFDLPPPMMMDASSAFGTLGLWRLSNIPVIGES